MSNNIPKISSTLKIAAIGISIALIPDCLFSLLSLADVVKEFSGNISRVLTGLLIIGYIIAGCALLACQSNAKKLGLSQPAFVLCAISLFLVTLFAFAIGFVEKFRSVYYNILFDGNEEHQMIIGLLLAAIKFMPIIIGTLMITRRIRAFSTLFITYLIFLLFPILDSILKKEIIHTDYYGYTSGWERYIKMMISVDLIVTVLNVIGWWVASKGTAKWEAKKAGNDIDSSGAQQPAYVAQTDGSTATYAASTTGQNGATTPSTTASTASTSSGSAPRANTAANTKAGTAVTEQQKQLIMSMSDQELSNVVNNPMLYANPAFVEEARSTLVKRQAWEMIKDYSDMQLLDIVHNNTQGFAYEVLDASSMELFARETEEFVNELRSLSDEHLHGIVANPGDYFDGYVRMAQRLIDQRLNNPGAHSQPGNPS